MGNKADLARTRAVDTAEGCDLAVQYGLKFTETSPGLGHHIDELLVGIVMQLRLHEDRSIHPQQPQHSVEQALRGSSIFSLGRKSWSIPTSLATCSLKL